MERGFQMQILYFSLSLQLFSPLLNEGRNFINHRLRIAQI